MPTYPASTWKNTLEIKSCDKFTTLNKKGLVKII
jgi:hypothetical protein